MTTAGPDPRLLAVGRWALLVALIVGGVAVVVWSPSLDPADLQAAAARWGFWAPVVLIAAYVAATLLAVPKNVLTIGAGLIFGFGWGAGLVWVGAMTGAVLAFWIGRFLGLDAVRRLAGPRYERFAQLAVRRGGVAVLLARLAPIVPFTLVNYASGVIGIGFIPYLAATAAGIIPGTAVYAALGAYGTSPTSWQFIAAAAVLVVGSVVAVVVARRRRGSVPPPSLLPPAS